MFLPFPTTGTCPDQTYEDLGVLPPELRTMPSHERADNGVDRSEHWIKPLTVLRRPCLGIVVEIVEISYWIEPKADGCTFYQVNLVMLKPEPFAKDQPRTISLDCNPFNKTWSDFHMVLALLKDAEAYIEQCVADRRR